MTAPAITPMTSPLTNDIERLVEGVPGWTPHDELLALSILAHATADVPGDIIEVGSWCGRSSVVLAQAAREIGAARVHCIDPFPDRDDWQRNADGSYSFRTTIDGQHLTGYTEQTVWGDAFASSLAPVYERCTNTFEIFRQVVSERELDPWVSVHRGTSRSFAAAVTPPFCARLIFLDGDHGYEAVAHDIRALVPMLSAGGWICFDDAFSGYDGVNRAIEDLVLADPSFASARQLTRKLFAARKGTVRRCV